MHPSGLKDFFSNIGLRDYTTLEVLAFELHSGDTANPLD